MPIASSMWVAYIITGVIAGGTIFALFAKFFDFNRRLKDLVAGDITPEEYESGRTEPQSRSEMDSIYRRVGISYLDIGAKILERTGIE